MPIIPRALDSTGCRGIFEIDFAGSTPRHYVAVDVPGSRGVCRGAIRDRFLAAGRTFSLMTAPISWIAGGRNWPSRRPELRGRPGRSVAAAAIRCARRSDSLGGVRSKPAQRPSTGDAARCCAGEHDADADTSATGTARAPNLHAGFSTASRIRLAPRSMSTASIVLARVPALRSRPSTTNFRTTADGMSVDAASIRPGPRKSSDSGRSGQGLGRYFGGLVPDAAFDSDGSIRPDRRRLARSAGVEQSLTDRVSVAGYLSGVNTDGNYSTDRDGSGIGFGSAGSPSRTTARFRS